MRHINGFYTQDFNRRHGKVGHVFQGRFKAILVDLDVYLLESCRYVGFSPVRAGIVSHPEQWPWSSYLAHTGQCPASDWLDVPGVHRFILGSDAITARDHQAAAKRCAEWVADAPDVRLWDDGLRHQIFLGDEAFVERMQALVNRAVSNDRNIPKAQRVATRTMAAWIQRCDSVEHTLYRGQRDGGLTLTAMAAAMSRSVSWPNKAVGRIERKGLRGRMENIKT